MLNNIIIWSLLICLVHCIFYVCTCIHVCAFAKKKYCTYSIYYDWAGSSAGFPRKKNTSITLLASYNELSSESIVM